MWSGSYLLTGGRGEQVHLSGGEIKAMVGPAAPWDRWHPSIGQGTVRVSCQLGKD